MQPGRESVLRAPVRLSQWWLRRCAGPRRLGLRAQARYHGGRVSLAKRIVFTHAVRFQGSGELIVGDDVTFGYYLAGAIGWPILLQPRERDSVIRIGKSTQIMNGCELMARDSITLGSECLIGAQTVILDADFHGVSPGARHEGGIVKPVVIEDNVWVGLRVVILKGVRIGRDAIVASSCVVTKDVGCGEIVAGNPMRVVGSVYERTS
jgi:acetyltransferase-like isoleucine patch superfamily enzyme